MSKRISTRPGRPRCRRFTLLDGMILVAGVAIGFAAWREPFETYLLAQGWKYWLHPLVGFALVLLAGLMLILRGRRPRPSIRRIASQPGSVACLAIVSHWLAFLADQLVRDAGRGWMEKWLYGFTWAEASFLFSREFHPAWSVVVCWTVLLLGRRWRPEPGWIDGTARWVGWAWIAWGLSGLALQWWEQFTPAPAGVTSGVPL